MPNNTVTLALEGDVSLDEFTDGVQHFRGLIEALSSQVSRQATIEWTIEELEGGSAKMTVLGESEDIQSVESVCVAVMDVARAVARNTAIGYGPKVANHARALSGILNGRITELRIETPVEDVTIYGQAVSAEPPPRLAAYGAVVGRIESLSAHRGLRFSLYDDLQDRAIACYLQEGQQEMMRDAWNHRAIVEGWVTRDPLTGRPLNIRRVSAVTVLPDVEAGSYRMARGVVPIGADGLSPEEAIRKVRDAG